MESTDDKEHSALRSVAFLSTVTKGARTHSTLSLARLFPYLSLLGLALLYTNLAIACGTSFTCGKFLPTPDYLGCFRGHDRLYIVTCAYSAAVFLLVAIGLITRLKPSSGSGKRALLLGTTVGVVTALPLLALTDEVNAVHFVSFEKIHAISVRVFQVSAVVWTLAAYSSLAKIHSMLNSAEKKWFLALKLTVYSLALLGVAAVAEKHFAYSVYSSKYINENVQATLEWTLSGLGIASLTLFSKFVRGFGLKFTVRTGEDDSEKSEVELAKV